MRQLRNLGLVMSSRVNLTSSAVNGAPSCQRTSSRRRIRHLRPSSEMPPFFWLGTSVARFGWTTPLRIDAEQSIEQREMNAIIDLDLRHQGIEDGGLLGEPDDDAAGRLFWRRSGRRPAFLTGWARRGLAAPPIAIIRSASRREYLDVPERLVIVSPPRMAVSAVALMNLLPGREPRSAAPRGSPRPARACRRIAGAGRSATAARSRRYVLCASRRSRRRFDWRRADRG